jgi:hypothetical protein
MTRMSMRLTELGLSRRLCWREIADIQADHEADLDAAVEQAIADEDFIDCWLGYPMRTARGRAIDALLRCDHAEAKPDDPDRLEAHYRVLELLAKHRGLTA